MNSSELRLGNWVWNHVTQSVVVVDIKVLSEQLYSDRGIGIDWQPIPIRDGWLLKFGFFYEDFTDRDAGILSILWQYNGFTYLRLMKTKTGYWCILKNKELEEQVNFRHINFIHELQNVFHSLAGTELTIKETAITE